MEKVRGSESKEKSFLKNVVGKRLEELASSQSRVDPLELLGLSTPTPSVPSAPVLPVASTIVEIPPHELSVVSQTPSEPYRMPASSTPITSVQLSSSLHNAARESAELSEFSDSALSRSDSNKIRPVHSESHTVRNTVSATDSLASSHSTPVIRGTHKASPIQTASNQDIPVSLLKPPSHWVRFAWALHSCRDQSVPSQTRPVSYAEIGALVDRTEDAVRRSLLQLMKTGLIVRKELLQYTNGGSIYLFGQAFPALLAPLPTAKKKGPRARPSGFLHSQNDSRNHSQTTQSSSYPSLTNSELLQDWGVHNLILSEWFIAVEPRSIEPFLRVMPSLEYAQDFFDKVAAVIEHKKQTAKPIADALGFLFACLKKLEVNPPPGWKSRRVRLLEDEAQRLEHEAAAIKAARDRVEAQRCELYFLGLPAETEAQLQAKAAEAAADTELAVVRDAKRDRKLQELIREHMQQHERTKTV